MSGGSWDYSFIRIEETADRLMIEKKPLRRALGKKLKLMAKALHDIEWVDSSDYGDGDDIPAIEEALGEDSAALVLAEIIAEADDVVSRIYEAIKVAKR